MNHISTPQASLLTDPCQDQVLLNEWHVVAYSHELVAEKLLPITLLERDLVDELRLMVFPIVLGSGKRLFGDEASEARRMRLNATKIVGDGVAVLTYEPAR